MRRIHYEGSKDFTACGRSTSRFRSSYWASPEDITSNPREVTCKRCLRTRPDGR